MTDASQLPGQPDAPAERCAFVHPDGSICGQRIGFAFHVSASIVEPPDPYHTFVFGWPAEPSQRGEPRKPILCCPNCGTYGYEWVKCSRCATEPGAGEPDNDALPITHRVSECDDLGLPQALISMGHKNDSVFSGLCVTDWTEEILTRENALLPIARSIESGDLDLDMVDADTLRDIADWLHDTVEPYIAALRTSSASRYRDAQPNAEQLARFFHDTYERLAPTFGYKTREESAVAWDNVPEQNKALMVAVCGEVLTLLEAKADK